MAQDYKSYRIRTEVGSSSPNVLNVHLEQTYDTFEILSLKIDSKNLYNLVQSDKGVVVGRVLANGGFGVPNAKVSIFIKTDDTMSMDKFNLYPYFTVNDIDKNQVRYNLLPDYVDDLCHQDVGTFPNKRLVLDNKDEIEIFEKFWKYTTRTNDSGDYMLYGVPTGSQMLHMDVDLSDIGLLSVRPRDMVYKGYDINLFESPNKFKKDTNLNNLSQLKTQDVGLYVYPFWGDTSDSKDDIAITRCDIQVDYKFEPTCIFMGSIITDSGSNAIGKNCAGTDGAGNMADMVAGEGKIEMIRKTFDGKVEEFQIKGNRLIDGDGVWCYQIPMNLDYMMTDEFGNLVPTDNPDRGIPTRTRVRFRISLDDTPTDKTATKRCMYLVPNNPRFDDRYPEFSADDNPDADYEFGTATRDEDYVDMLWNNVYTVKNYIPRIQKKAKATNRMHTGIKLVNHYGDNNPMPYNSLNIKLSFQYRFICILSHIFIELVSFLNGIISLIGTLPCILYELFHSIAKLFFRMKIFGVCLGCPIGEIFESFANLFKKIIPSCVSISTDFCGTDVTHAYTYYPGCGKFLGVNISSLIGSFSCVWDKTEERHNEAQRSLKPVDRTEATNYGSELKNCVESELAQSNDATSFNFANDWINGVLYAPQWYRHIVPKRTYLFGLFKRRSRDEWCSANHQYDDAIYLYQSCAAPRNTTTERPYTNFVGNPVTPHYFGDDSKDKTADCGDECHERHNSVGLKNGLIVTKDTMLGQTAYYYKPVEYDKEYDGKGDEFDGLKLLFATDIVLLGSLNGCDLHGVPQFFKYLEGTTYKLPSNMLFTDNDIIVSIGKDGIPKYEVDQISTSEMTGCDWGNGNDDLCPNVDGGGLFYNIGCSAIDVKVKSCFNLSRICEFGVSLDETKHIPNLAELSSGDESAYDTLVPDGFVSKDELYNDDERSMFATLNCNGLRTIVGKNGMKEYDFRYLHLDNFDNSLYTKMKEVQKSCDKTPKLNYNLENFSKGYYDFRMGAKPKFYPSMEIVAGSSDEFAKNMYSFPRYENSLYFYFGLKHGKTAIDKFNSQFFAECSDSDSAVAPFGVIASPNGWCEDGTENAEGYMAFNLTKIDKPCTLYINSMSDIGSQIVIEDIEEDDKIFISPHKDELEGYVNYTDKITYPETMEEFYSMFKNGMYEVDVVDANGETSTTSLSMRAEYLTFKGNSVGFEFSEYDLSHIFYDDATGDELYKKVGKRVGHESDKDIFGGYIEIGNISVDHFTIKVSGNIKIKSNEYIDAKYELTLRKNGDSFDVESESGSDYMCYSLSDDGKIKFYLPKGNEIYKVEVTELCGEEIINNKTVKSYKVMYPEPFKLYINDIIDYDVISDWNTGWKMTDCEVDADDNACEKDGVMSDKWLHMSEITNYKWGELVSYQNVVTRINDLFERYGIDSTVEDLIPNSPTVSQKYIFSKSIYVAEGDYPSGLPDEFSILAKNVYRKVYDNVEEEANRNERCEEVVNLINKIVEIEAEFINAMKSTFQLNCEIGSSTFNFSATGNKKPFIYHMFYRDEAETTELYVNELAYSGMSYRNEGDIISGFIIPTITTQNNEKYGTVCGHGDKNWIGDDYPNLCFATDNNSTEGDKNKYPYFIAVSNSSKETRPKDIVVDDEGKMNDNDANASKVFGFHVIDKVFRFDSRLWGSVKDIPYFLPWSSSFSPHDDSIPVEENEIDRNKAGKLINLEGMLYGKIYNGNASGYEGNYAIFEEQEIGNKKFDVYTFRVNGQTDEELEDSVPTERAIVGDREGEPQWKNLVVDDRLPVDKQQYVGLKNSRAQYLRLSDENGCFIGRNIDANFAIVLDSSSVNDVREYDNRIFKVRTTVGSNVIYYVYDYRHWIHEYPLNCVYNDNGVDVFDMGALGDKVFGRYGFRNGSPYALFSPNTKYYDYYDNNRTDNEYTIMDTDTYSTYGDEDVEGYSDTGDFRFAGRDEIRPMKFVVARSEDGLFAISPVYDFAEINVYIRYYKKPSTSGSSEYTYGIGVGLWSYREEDGGVKDYETANKEQPVDFMHWLYYFNYYPYDMTVKFELGDYGVYSATEHLEPYTDLNNRHDLISMIVWANNDEENQKLHDLFEDTSFEIEGDECYVGLKDITGLKHIADVGRGSLQFKRDIRVIQ